VEECAVAPEGDGLLDRWLAELATLAADAPEWNDLDDFILSAQALAARKQSEREEREAVRNVLSESLRSFVSDYSAALPYFGHANCAAWDAGACPPGEVGGVIVQFAELRLMLDEHAALRQRSTAAMTMAEARSERLRLDQLEDEIARLYAALGETLRLITAPVVAPAKESESAESREEKAAVKFDAADTLTASSSEVANVAAGETVESESEEPCEESVQPSAVVEAGETPSAPPEENAMSDGPADSFITEPAESGTIQERRSATAPALEAGPEETLVTDAVLVAPAKRLESWGNQSDAEGVAQPAYSCAPEAAAAEIAARLSQHPIHALSPAVRDLVWCLLAEEKYGLAYHLAACLDDAAPASVPRLPAWLLRAVALAPSVRHPDGEIARLLTDDFALFGDHCFRRALKSILIALRSRLDQLSQQPAVSHRSTLGFEANIVHEIGNLAPGFLIRRYELADVRRHELWELTSPGIAPVCG